MLGLRLIVWNPKARDAGEFLNFGVHAIKKLGSGPGNMDEPWHV